MPTETDVGSVALSLGLGSKVTIASVAWDIKGGSFHETGNIDVSNSAQAAAVIDGIPFGSGYVATLTASSSGTPSVTCEGASTFSVSSRGVTPVPVHLVCKEEAAPPPPPPPSVPIPRGALLILSGLLVMLGSALLRAIPRAERRSCDPR